MKVFWINLEHSVERRKFMNNEFSSKGYNDTIRINAVNIDTMKKYLSTKNYPLKCGFHNCKNCEIETACMLSHMLAIEEGYKSGEDWFMIMEDDTYIPFEIDYTKLIQSAPVDSEVLQLIVSTSGQLTAFKQIYTEKNINWIRWGCLKCIFPCAAAYLINKKGAKRMLDLLKENNLWNFTNTNGCRLADVITFQNCITFTTTFPLFYSNTQLISNIHPEHLTMHQEGVNMIKNIQQNCIKPAYIIKEFIK